MKEKTLEQKEFELVLKGLLGIMAYKLIEFIVDVVEEIKKEIER
jgi:hypothetical protein